MKKQKFFESDWDHAIILDSARYDAFQEVYQDYFAGSLEKRRSKASATPEWVEKIFSGYHEIDYFSANPFINSLGIPPGEMISEDYSVNPSMHIERVFDLWKTEWDGKYGTVRPGDVYTSYRERDDIDGRRTVVHFMQPHVPFLEHGKGRINKYLRKNLVSGNGDASGSMMNDKFSGLVNMVENRETVMKLGLISSLSGEAILEVLLNNTSEKLMDYHRSNMRKALENARKLAEDMEGKVVITSDHGEAFGEQGVWGHHVETHIPPLVEVPWLEVEEIR